MNRARQSKTPFASDKDRPVDSLVRAVPVLLSVKILFSGADSLVVRRFDAAQIGNLLYRGLAIRRASETKKRRRLPVGETADCQSALLGLWLRRTKQVPSCF